MQFSSTQWQKRCCWGGTLCTCPSSRQLHPPLALVSKLTHLFLHGRSFSHVLITWCHYENPDWEGLASQSSWAEGARASAWQKDEERCTSSAAVPCAGYAGGTACDSIGIWAQQVLPIISQLTAASAGCWWPQEKRMPQPHMLL